MLKTGNLGLKKPQGTDVVNIDDINSNMDKLDIEVVKKASHSVNGRMSKEDKTKLDGITSGANKYVHPSKHSAGVITQDSSHRFVTDIEKNTWNNKANGEHTHDDRYYPKKEIYKSMADIAYKLATINDRNVQLTVPSFTFVNNKYILVELTEDIPEGHNLIVKVNSDKGLILKDTDNKNITILDKGFYTLIARTGTPNFFLLAPKGSDTQPVYGAYDGTNRIELAKVKKGNYVYLNGETWIDTAIKLNDVKSSNIVADDEWIYYENLSDNNYMYKVRLDGTNNKKINLESSNVYALDNEYVYYTTSPDLNIHKIRKSNSVMTKVNYDESDYVSVDNEWIYYRNKSDGNNIYKIRKDGTGKTKIADDNTTGYAMDDEYIYYRNYSDGGHMYKIKKDGTGRIQLNNNSSFVYDTDDEWIYYRNISDNSTLYKIKKDGTNAVRLNTDPSYFVRSDGEWIYYRNNSDNYTLYKIKKDGSNRTKIIYNSIENPLLVGDYILYDNIADNSCLYKIKKNSSEIQVIPSVDKNWNVEIAKINVQYKCLAIDDTYLYVSDDNYNKIHKINKYTSDKITLNSSYGNYLNLDNEYIYFSDYGDNIKLYKMKKNGTDKTKVSNDVAKYTILDDKYIYYENLSDNNCLYKIKKDGTCRQKLTFTGSIPGAIDNEYVYYRDIDENYVLYRIQKDGTNKQKLNNNGASYVITDDEYIYYCNRIDNYTIYKIKKDGTDEQKLNNDKSNYIILDDQYIYYENLSDNNYLYRIKKDGTDKQRINNEGSRSYITDNEFIYFKNISKNNFFYKIRKYNNEPFKVTYSGNLIPMNSLPKQFAGNKSKRNIDHKTKDLLQKSNVIYGKVQSSSTTRNFTKFDKSSDAKYYIEINLNSFDFIPKKIIVNMTASSSNPEPRLTYWQYNDFWSSSTASCNMVCDGEFYSYFDLSGTIELPVANPNASCYYTIYGGDE